MVATQEVRGKDDMKVIQQGRLDTGLTCTNGGYDLCHKLL
jgi:hypothetical protein